MPESDRTRWIRYFAPSYLYAAIIFMLSSIPVSVPSIACGLTDKFLHLAEYCVFGFLVARSFRNAATRFLHRQFLVLAIITASLYGLLDECHQLLVPNRHFEFFDIAANAAGAVLGALVYSLTCLKKNHSRIL